jgi:hypothetical protein
MGFVDARRLFLLSSLSHGSRFLRPARVAACGLRKSYLGYAQAVLLLCLAPPDGASGSNMKRFPEILSGFLPGCFPLASLWKTGM